MRRGRLITVAMLGLIGGILAGILFVPGMRERIAGAAPTVASFGKAQVGGPFALVDHTGKAVTDKDYRGRYMMVYFGFTFCPDVCPTGLQVMAQAIDKLGPKGAKVQPLLITLDPERDTPQQLASYVASFHPRLVGLTGTPEAIANAARAYRVYFKKVQDEKSTAGYMVDHTSIIYVMDPAGEFVAHFTHASSVDAIVQRLQKLL